MRITSCLLFSLVAIPSCTDSGGGDVLTDPQSDVDFDVLSRDAITEAGDLMGALPTSHLSLADGMAQASSDGFVISGKFEMADDGSGLSLSIYTARDGRDTIPEANELAELAGSPTGAAWAPGAEVFADYEHIARASSQLTLMSLTTVTLDQVTRAASTEGTVYNVEPTIVDGHAAFAVLVVADDGTAEQLELAVQP